MPDASSVPRGARMRVDPITFQVVYNALLATAREMGTTMLRTSHSVIFSEGYDFSCAILNPVGQMVATANYCPVHLAAMAYASSWALVEIGIENIHDGDVIIHNDPYRGGTHITDVTVIKPVFDDGQLIAFAANRGHQLDMGGKTPGSFAGDAVDIFQEGIRIPPIKWFEDGRERIDVLDFILSNVRLPRVQLGDFRAQLASNVTCERRLHAICEKYGRESLTKVMYETMDYSERLMRAEVAAIPDGLYEFEDWMDDDGITGDPIPLHVAVEVTGDSITVDYSGSSAQVAGPVNATYGVTASSTFNALLETLDPSIPVNHGAFRPVTIIAPRGSIVNPNYPAPVQGGNTNTAIALVGLVVGALAQALPDRVVAGSGGTDNDFTCGGFDPDRESPFVFYWFPPTGWGALRTRDGWSAISDPVSNCSDTPVEMMESLYPFVYEQYELSADCEGPGKFRGGYGITQAIRTRADMTVSAIAERHVFPPYGLYEGQVATVNEFAVRRRQSDEWKSFSEDAGVVSPGKFSGVKLCAGDVWLMRTSGGGGFGDPLDRDPVDVLRDVEDGLVSRERAESEYGVVVIETENGLELDHAATRRLRSEIRTRRTTKNDDSVVTVGCARSGSSAPLRPRRVRGDDPAYSVLKRAQNGVPTEFCASECPLGGDPHRCPWHNEEMLEFWSVDLLHQWTTRRCPANKDILSHLRSTKA